MPMSICETNTCSSLSWIDSESQTRSKLRTTAHAFNSPFVVRSLILMRLPKCFFLEPDSNQFFHEKTRIERKCREKCGQIPCDMTGTSSPCNSSTGQKTEISVFNRPHGIKIPVTKLSFQSRSYVLFVSRGDMI